MRAMGPVADRTPGVSEIQLIARLAMAHYQFESLHP
jgi:Fic family protein